MLNSFKLLRSGAARFAVACLALSLVACGGGGGSSNTTQGNLQVTYSYAGVSTLAGNLTVLTAVNLPAPQVLNLGSNRAHFTLTSGGLPPGLSLDTNTGVVSGVPTGTGSFTANITITVDGFSGSLVSPLVIGVNEIYLSYAPTFTGRTLPIGTPITDVAPFGLPATTAGTRSFSVVGGIALPAGLSLNAQTGVISGTPTALFNTGVTIQMSVSYLGQTRTAQTTEMFWVV